MHPFWRDTLRHGLQVLAFCCVIAVFTTMMWPGSGYARQLVHSISIGMITWAVIEFGRLLVPAQHCHRNPDTGGHGWPRGWRGVALTAAGIAAGFFGGTRLARLLLGDVTEYPQRDLVLGLLVTVAAGTVASFYFHARGQAAALQASLRALIGVDPPAAQRMVDRLNDYLRATLDASRATTHPLSAEFERLRDYLDLMAIRMGPRLAASFDLPEALRDLPVPPLILQPLVENAIRHGLEPQVAGGRIDVRAERVGDTLRLTVADTGAGFDATHVREGRFGMAQVIERVASSTGGRGVVHVQSAPGAGTTVALELPIDQASA